MINRYDLKYVIKRILIGTGIIILVTLFKSCDVHAISYDDLTNSTDIVVSGFSGNKPGSPWTTTFIYGDSNPVMALNLPNPSTYPNLAIYFPTLGKLQKGHRYSLNFYYSRSDYFDFSNSKYWYDGGTSNVKNLNDFKSIQNGNAQITNMWGWGTNLIANYNVTTFVFDVKEELTTDYFSLSFKNKKASNNNFFIGGYSFSDMGTYITEQDIIDNQDKNHQETMDTITDSSVDSDSISSLGETNLPSNGVLSAILNLPIMFFRNLLNSLNTTTCLALSFTLPFVDTNCSIPCFRSILSDMGVLTWYEGIGGLVGGLLIFTYLIHLGKTFNKMSDLDDTNNESWGGL